METAATAILLLFLVSSSSFCLAFNAVPDSVTTKPQSMSLSIDHRKLQGKTCNENSILSRRDLSEANLADYHMVDPAPSQSTTKSGPIEHSSPFIPWIISWSPPPSSVKPSNAVQAP